MAFLEPMFWAEQALTATDVGTVWQVVLGALSRAGMGEATFLFGQPVNMKAVPASARKFGVFLDEEWDGRINRDPALALADPIARRFFAGEQALVVQRGNELFRSMNEREQAFYRHYDEHDVRAGAVWPVHDRKAGTVHVIATWTKSPPRDYLKAVAHHDREVHIAMTWLCEALRVRELTRRCPRVALSPRERECLLWVQAGRSTKDIGDRLMLSDATVNEYIVAAMRKLDASNRIQAAARAAMLGLIRP